MAAHPHIIEEYVRWSDVDFAGIICYGAYLRFFEIAETELFRTAGLAYRDVFDRYDVWFPPAGGGGAPPRGAWSAPPPPTARCASPRPPSRAAAAVAALAAS